MTSPTTSLTPENKNKSKIRRALDSQQPSISAVNYLNMLPFFFDTPAVRLYNSPQELNQNLADNGAFCSSLIAGIKAKKKPITTRFGVFSSQAVMTVYVEPSLTNEAHIHFWMQLEELWRHPNPNPTTTLKQTEPQGTIVLRSAGESAQSVWIFEVLSALAGFKVIVQKPEDPPVLNARGKPLPEAQLFIGDKALLRRRQCSELYRLDLGELWARHTTRKPWFAGWFAGDQLSHDARESLEHFLSKQLEKWNELSEFSRWCKCFELLEQQFPSESTQWTQEQIYELREELGDYFLTLEHSLAADEGDDLFAFYCTLDESLAVWRDKEPNKTPLGAHALSETQVSAHSEST